VPSDCRLASIGPLISILARTKVLCLGLSLPGRWVFWLELLPAGPSTGGCAINRKHSPRPMEQRPAEPSGRATFPFHAEQTVETAWQRNAQKAQSLFDPKAGRCRICGCTDEKPCQMLPDPDSPIAGQNLTTCAWAMNRALSVSIRTAYGKRGNERPLELKSFRPTRAPRKKPHV
jgi:hypothetical protein